MYICIYLYMSTFLNAKIENICKHLFILDLDLCSEWYMQTSLMVSLRKYWHELKTLWILQWDRCARQHLHALHGGKMGEIIFDSVQTARERERFLWHSMRNGNEMEWMVRFNSLKQPYESYTLFWIDVTNLEWLLLLLLAVVVVSVPLSLCYCGFISTFLTVPLMCLCVCVRACVCMFICVCDEGKKWQNDSRNGWWWTRHWVNIWISMG